MVVWFNPWGCACGEMKTSLTFSNSPLPRIHQYLSLINYFLMESVPFILANPWDNVHGYGWIEVIKLLTFRQNFQTFLLSISKSVSLGKTTISLLSAFSLCLLFDQTCRFLANLLCSFTFVPTNLKKQQQHKFAWILAFQSNIHLQCGLSFH